MGQAKVYPVTEAGWQEHCRQKRSYLVTLAGSSVENLTVLLITDLEACP